MSLYFKLKCDNQLTCVFANDLTFLCIFLEPTLIKLLPQL